MKADLKVILLIYLNWILKKMCTNCPSFSLKNEKSRNIVNVLESVFKFSKNFSLIKIFYLQ